MAALAGEAVDRVPLSFWMHNFAAENTVKDFVAETLRLARQFGWDYLKPQSRAQCFAEAWGLQYQPSGERAVPYTRTHAPCASAADLRRLRRLSGHYTTAELDAHFRYGLDVILDGIEQRRSRGART